MQAHPLCRDLSRQKLKPIKLAYNRLAGWPTLLADWFKRPDIDSRIG